MSRSSIIWLIIGGLFVVGMVANQTKLRGYIGLLQGQIATGKQQVDAYKAAEKDTAMKVVNERQRANRAASDAKAWRARYELTETRLSNLTEVRKTIKPTADKNEQRKWIEARYGITTY